MFSWVLPLFRPNAACFPSMLNVSVSMPLPELLMSDGLSCGRGAVEEYHFGLGFWLCHLFLASEAQLCCCHWFLQPLCFSVTR